MMIIIRKMNFLFLVLLSLLVRTRANCHTADIINAIGGSTFTVDRITATHASTTTDPYLVIAGKYTKISSNADVGAGAGSIV